MKMQHYFQERLHKMSLPPSHSTSNTNIKINCCLSSTGDWTFL